MNLRLLAALACLLGIASGCATTDSPATVNASAASAKAADGDDTPGALPALTKGMTADQILKLAGKPTKVEAKTSDSSIKAEVWTYRRLVNTTTNQVVTGVTNVPAYNPVPGAGPSEAPEAQYTLEHVKTYQVTELLMINDKLQASTTKFEQKRYDDE